MRAKFLRRQRKLTKEEAGFTLVEVLIAMLVLATGIMALTMMMKQSVGATDYGRKVTVAENLAMQTLEDYKAQGYMSIPASDTKDYGTITGYPEYRLEMNTSILEGVEPLHPEGFLKRVTVTVRWRSVGSIGQGGNVTLATLVSK